MEKKDILQSRYLIAVIFLITIYLGFKGLDNLYFWDDEAQVGIIARNFLSTGELTGWDGRNLYAFYNGGALDDNLRTRNPPLDILICALSFKLFGISTWSGRFLFVIIGLLSLWVFYFVIKDNLGNDPWLLFYTLSVFALSPVFLLNIRQCRYYSLLLFLTLLGYYFYRRSLSSKKITDFMILCIASIFSFYANPMTCAAFLLSLGIIHLLFHHRVFSLREWKIMGIMIILFLLTTVPYALYYQIWNRPDHTQLIQEPWLTKHLHLIWWNLRDLNTMTIMPWVILLGLIYLFWRYRKKEPVLKIGLEWGILSLLNVIFIALLSPQPTFSPGLADFRYLLASVPFLLGLVGLFLWYIHRWSRWVGITLMIMVISSNVLTLTPFNYEFRWLLPAYLYDIHQDHPTSYSAVVKYLDSHVEQDALVQCYPDSFTYPVMFYLSHKIKFCGMLDDRPFISKEIVEKLPAPLFNYENFPDWIIVFGTHESFRRYLGFYSRIHQENGENVRYSYKMKSALDIYWKDTGRPELNLHYFGPVLNYDIHNEAVYIFKKEKINNTQP